MQCLPAVKALFLAVAVACMGASTALAQDPAKVDPRHYQVALENDRVRVLRVEFGPHDRSVMHSHPDAVAIFLTQGEAKSTDPWGKTEERRWKLGQVSWEPAVRRATENPTDKTWMLILVELKRQPVARMSLPPTRIDHGTPRAKLVHFVRPTYPPEAKARGIQGRVVLDAVIGRDGNIKKLRLVSGPPVLVQAAIAAVKQWRYRPILVDGKPVEAETDISVAFKLP